MGQYLDNTQCKISLYLIFLQDVDNNMQRNTYLSDNRLGHVSPAELTPVTHDVYGVARTSSHTQKLTAIL